MTPHPTPWRSILILPSHLRMVLQSDLFYSGFPTKILYTPLFSTIRHDYFNVRVIHFISLKISCKQIKSNRGCSEGRQEYVYCRGKQKINGCRRVPSKCRVVFLVKVGLKPIENWVDGKPNVRLYRKEKDLCIWAEFWILTFMETKYKHSSCHSQRKGPCALYRRTSWYS